ncbi:MAG: hypothetical protein ACI814_004799 [Mariniblastus sp.]|jgi:hypothetical protein
MIRRFSIAGFRDGSKANSDLPAAGDHTVNPAMLKTTSFSETKKRDITSAT